MTEPAPEPSPVPADRLGRRTVLALAAAVLAVSVPSALLLAPRASAGGTVAAASPSPTTPAAAAEGRVVYEERCATCHGTQGQGTGQAPPIAGLGPAFYDFMMATGRMPLDQTGTQPRRRPPVLSPGQIRAVSDYLTSISPGGIAIPQVDPAGGSLPVGQAIYQSTCAPCHGAIGKGGAVGSQDAPPLDEATARQVAEAVRIGPGTMPVFDESTVDQHQLDSLVRYVLYLRHPRDRGGNGLGGVGPLVEGFVALVGGLGLMVLVTRTIGTRA
jgi:ubiquinol-cytochrome c reductase cytochrome c subunit